MILIRLFLLLLRAGRSLSAASRDAVLHDDICVGGRPSSCQAVSGRPAARPPTPFPFPFPRAARSPRLKWRQRQREGESVDGMKPRTSPNVCIEKIQCEAAKVRCQEVRETSFHIIAASQMFFSRSECGPRLNEKVTDCVSA